MQRQIPMPTQKQMPHKNVIYKARVTTKNEIKQYIGSTGDLLKQGGIAMLQNLKYRNKTAPNCQNTFGS